MNKKQKYQSFLIFFIFGFFLSQFFLVSNCLTAVAKKPDPSKILTYCVANESGDSLKSKNLEKVVPVASLTKLMTAIVFVENRNKEWDEEIIYNPQKHFVYGNYLKLKKGDAVTVKDLLYSMLVGSVNEPPKMLIEATKLNEKQFVKKMNEKAGIFNMKKTTYVDTSGISPKNVSTAAEQIKLLEEIYKYPDLREVLESVGYEFNVVSSKGVEIFHSFKHTNSLLAKKTNFSILASKTGYLWEAKNNLAMIIQKNGRIYYSVTMGDPSRFGDYSNTEALLEKTLPQQVSARF